MYQEYGAGFEDGKGIHRKKKYRIAAMTWIVMLISIYFVPLWPVRIFVILCGIVFTCYLFFKLPDRPADMESGVKKIEDAEEDDVPSTSSKENV